MKIHSDHLLRFIKNKPSLDQISKDLFQLGHEHDLIEEIFDFEFTPNRGDCLSLRGLSRDLGVFYNLCNDLKIYKYDIPELKLNFLNLAKSHCPKISFLKVKIQSNKKEYQNYLNDYFKDLGFKTVLEGLEASINYPAVLYKNPKEMTGRREVINYFRPEKGIDNNPSKDPDYGSETINSGAYLYGAYTHEEMIERMSLGGFGSDLMYFKENIYGDNVEYCHTDCFAAGVIPIFHKHFCDNVIHRKQGKPISECINTGTIGIDATNAEATAHDMLMMTGDPVMRDEWRNMMFEFWKDHCDAKVVYDDIINKTLNYNEKNETTLEDFFV